MKNNSSNPVENKSHQWLIFAIDEKKYWNIPARFIPYIKEIRTIYLTDLSIPTYCCEITPSYYLMDFFYDPVCKIDTPETIREQIFEFCMSAPFGEGQYYHCKVIENIRKNNPELCFLAVGHEDKTEEEIIEMWNANPQF